MSLILDALNRSQRDLKQHDTVPGIDTVPTIEAMSGSGKKSVAVVIAVLSSLAMIIGVFIFTRGETALDDTAAAIAVQSNDVMDIKLNADVGRPAPSGAAVANAQALRSDASTDAHSGIAEKQTASQRSAVAALYATPKPEQPEGRASAVTAIEPVLSKEQGSPPQAKKIDVEEVLSRAKASLETAQLQEHTAPFIAELSQQIKDSIPTIYYSLHDYSSAQKSSYAVLNGKRVRAGDVVSGKLRVLEILPDSIVLDMAGTEFRLKALNSWVNL